MAESDKPGKFADSAAKVQQKELDALKELDSEEIVEDCVQPGAWVCILDNRGSRSLAWAKPGQVTAVKKKKIPVNPIIGAPYGTIFAVDAGKLVRTDNLAFGDSIEEFDTGDAGLSQEKDNSGYWDASKPGGGVFGASQAQKLSEADIDTLKESGVSAGTVVKALIEGSDTFSKKTAFAQSKWMSRKHKTYASFVRVLRCSPSVVCDCLFEKNPKMTCFLTSTMLAQLLGAANVFAGRRVLVVEACQGLVLGAVLHKMGGHGAVASVVTKTTKKQSLLLRSGLAQKDLDICTRLTWHEACQLAEVADGLTPPFEPCVEEPEAVEEEAPYTGERKRKEIIPLPGSTEPLTMNLFQKGRMHELQSVVKDRYNSMVLVAGFNYLEVMRRMWPLLAPGAWIAVFSSTQEPLTQLHDALRRGLASAVSISQGLCREYQILPMRTRPVMSMALGFSSYLIANKLPLLSIGANWDTVTPPANYTEAWNGVLRELNEATAQVPTRVVAKRPATEMAEAGGPEQPPPPLKKRKIEEE